jgi:hypothetical protein
VTLDEFVDQGVRVAHDHGYHPTKFLQMRQSGQYTTIALIRHLVETSEPRSGFVRMKELGLQQWTLEAAVLKFQDEFKDLPTIKYAQARMDGILDA